MKRSPLRRKTGLSRNASQPLRRSEGFARGNGPVPRSTPQNASQRVGRAPKCWTAAKAKRPEWGEREQGDRLEQHHVVYAQHVEAAGGDVWDPRNSLTITVRIHGRHHDGSAWRLPLSALTDENYAFARELFGPYAFDYLTRRYAGSDPRVAALLAGV